MPSASTTSSFPTRTALTHTRAQEAIVYSEIDLSELGDVSARQLFFKHRRPTEYGPLLAVSGSEGGQ